MACLKEKSVTRAASEIWLVGPTADRFTSPKLPSCGDVLKVLFHYHNRAEMTLKDSTSKTTDLLLTIWDRARIPTKAANHVGEHIIKLHKEWQGLKKLINRKS